MSVWASLAIWEASEVSEGPSEAYEDLYKGFPQMLRFFTAKHCKQLCEIKMFSQASRAAVAKRPDLHAIFGRASKSTRSASKNVELNRLGRIATTYLGTQNWGT